MEPRELSSREDRRENSGENFILGCREKDVRLNCAQQVTLTTESCPGGEKKDSGFLR